MLNPGYGPSIFLSLEQLVLISAVNYDKNTREKNMNNTSSLLLFSLLLPEIMSLIHTTPKQPKASKLKSVKQCFKKHCFLCYLKVPTI